MSSSHAELKAQGHQYLEVVYITIEGAGGRTRCYSHELAAWLAARLGTMIVRLEVIT